MTAADSTRTTFRGRMILTTAIAMLGLAGAAQAQAGSGPVDLKVVDRDTGQVLRVWRHHGRLFVAGHPGARYSLRVTNHTDGRVLVVLSVDGVNVLSGETAGYDQQGYVFSPYDSYEVTGWRKSNTEVAAFTFAPLPQSYAARTGRPADVGVIGLAVFKEKSYAPLPEPNRWDDREDADGDSGLARGPAPGPPSSKVVPAQRAAPMSPSAEARDYASGAASARRDEKLGTGHGAREWSAVNIVNFERATSHPQFTRQIEYDTYANLVSRGVIRTSAYTPRHPRPFPSNPDGAGYVPDPPE